MIRRLDALAAVGGVCASTLVNLRTLLHNLPKSFALGGWAAATNAKLQRVFGNCSSETVRRVIKVGVKLGVLERRYVLRGETNWEGKPSHTPHNEYCVGPELRNALEPERESDLSREQGSHGVSRIEIPSSAAPQGPRLEGGVSTQTDPTPLKPRPLARIAKPPQALSPVEPRPVERAIAEVEKLAAASETTFAERVRFVRTVNTIPLSRLTSTARRRFSVWVRELEDKRMQQRLEANRHSQQQLLNNCLSWLQRRSV